MDKNGILLEQKRAELQVKLTILQENINNLKNELANNGQNFDSNNSDDQISNPQISNLISLSNEYNAANELYKLKQFEKNSLEAELKKEKIELDKMRQISNDLIQQRTSLEQENLFYLKKSKELEDKLNFQKNKLFEIKNNKEILKQEVDILKNEHISNTRYKYDNEIIEIEKKILTIGENTKAYNEKINVLQREIDDTRDYINNSKKEKKILEKKLEQLTDILEKINQTNIKINANLNIVKKSLEKKAEFMKKEEDYYTNCEKIKEKMIETCKEINSYSDLI